MTPPESTHAVDLAGLRQPDVTFWSVMDGDTVAGCGALKELGHDHAEIKSMRVATAYARRGVASMLLKHMIAEARRRGYRRLSLETGSAQFFAPARGLYAKHGFEICEPFGDYGPDPHSAFMSRAL